MTEHDEDDGDEKGRSKGGGTALQPPPVCHTESLS